MWLLSPTDANFAALAQASCSQSATEQETAVKHQRISEGPSLANNERMLSSGSATLRESEAASREYEEQPMSTSEPIEETQNSAQAAAMPRARSALSLSDYFALTREANPSGAHVLVCALHATLLEGGWLPTCCKQVPRFFLAASGFRFDHSFL